MKKSALLRKLMSEQNILVSAGGSYDCLSAKLVEQAGFKATTLTGYGLQASMLGQPDVGLLTMTEMVNQAQNIASAVHIPVLADAEQGFGGIINLQRTIREFERAGIACISVADQTYPTLATGNALVPTEEMTARIQAALAAREDPDFVFCARTESGIISLDEVITRCNAYAEAGADLVKPILPRPRDPRQFDVLARSVKAPMWLSLDATYGVTVSDLENLGIRGIVTVLSGTALMMAAFSAMKSLLEELRGGGTGGQTLSRLGRPKSQELEVLTGLPILIETEKRYSAPLKDPGSPSP
ncbi:MAG: isocitrate lyase/PEP mutase family protein [Chloroflexi bacterium]|nr:isocitrate lyase/PEP mutase family protein [Chloroflexota bacterium]